MLRSFTCWFVTWLMTAGTAEAACILSGATPPSLTPLPTAPGPQRFGFVATDDCVTLRFSIDGGATTKTPLMGGPAGSGRHRYMVALSPREWEAATAGATTLTWIVMGRAATGPLVRLRTTNELDLDRDTWTRSGGDCNDADSSIHPDAQEDCYDGMDQDCDGSTTCVLPYGRDELTESDLGDADDVFEYDFASYGLPSPYDADVRVRGAFESTPISCDVNGDGIEDLILGPGQAVHPGLTYSFTWFVFRGPLTGGLSLDMADATISHTSGSVSDPKCGDLTGDGIDDLTFTDPWLGINVFSGADLSGDLDFSDAYTNIYGEYREFVYVDWDGANCVEKGTGGSAWFDRDFAVMPDYSGDGEGDLAVRLRDYKYIVSAYDAAAEAEGCSNTEVASDMIAVYVGPLPAGSYVYDDLSAYPLFNDPSGAWLGGGAVIVGAADLDDNGQDDLVIDVDRTATPGTTARLDLIAGGSSGFLGETGNLLATIDFDTLGSTATLDPPPAFGDMNGDGIVDMLVGGSRDGTESWSAVILDGPLSGTIDGESDASASLYAFEGSGCGASIPTPAGDVNGDGYADLHYMSQYCSGAVTSLVFAGPFGSGPYTASDAIGRFEVDDALGSVLGARLHTTSIGDQNGDGRDELVVGATYVAGLFEGE